MLKNLPKSRKSSAANQERISFRAQCEALSIRQFDVNKIEEYLRDIFDFGEKPQCVYCDDDKNITILSASSKDKSIKSNDKKSKTEISKVVAESLAKKALEKKITKIYFDRGIYKYHGRVKVFAETLRKNGMKV